MHRVTRAQPVESTLVTTDYLVLSDGGRVEARSATRLGFDRPEQTTFRQDLAVHCYELVAEEGDLLHAIYSHPHLAGDLVDVENVLTYNIVQSSLRRATTHGLVLERGHVVEPDARFLPHLTHAMTYELTNDDGFSLWPSTRLLASVQLDGLETLRSPKPLKVWAAVRRAGVMTHVATATVPEAVTVDVTVTAPETAPFGLLAVLKPLVDGLLAALHEYEGPHLDLLIERLPGLVPGLSPEEVKRWLTPAMEQPMGRAKFLFPRASGVQVSPADDRIVALRLTRRTGDRSGVRCSVSDAGG